MPPDGQSQVQGMFRKCLPFLALAALGACATPHEAQVSISGTADAGRALLASMHDVELAAATTGAGPAVSMAVKIRVDLARSA